MMARIRSRVEPQAKRGSGAIIRAERSEDPWGRRRGDKSRRGRAASGARGVGHAAPTTLKSTPSARRSVRAPVLLLCLLLAGCSDAAPGEDAEPLEATPTTGVLRGVVVDASVTPVEGAEVALVNGNDTTRTDASGLFGFDGLEPGIHFLRVEKDGFFGVEAQAAVRAGEAEPERVRIGLVRDPDQTPFVESSTWTGFIQCSVRVETVALGPAGVAVCSAGEPTVDLDDDVFHALSFGGAPEWVQTDLEWTSTQPLGDEMSLRYGPDSCEDTKWGASEGPSPLTVSMPRVLLEDKGVGAGTGLCVRVFVWVSDAAADLVGAGVQQDFEAFTHAFYNFQPREGWSFPEDGAHPVPDA